MKALKVVLLLSVVIGIAVLSCQQRPNITNPQMPNTPITLGLPGLTLDSAYFYIFVSANDIQTVNVHRVTADWAENTVTWNSFNGAYDPSVISSFSGSSLGWQKVDIKPLVQGWIDGTFPNYGLLIEQSVPNFTEYFSSEYAAISDRPMLKIGYTLGGVSTIVTIQRGTNLNVADAMILQNLPDINTGSMDALFTGVVSSYLKMSLLKFDIPTIVIPAGIGDFVWFDDNRDGIQDLGEPGFAGVTVNLMDCAGNIVATDITDSNGHYWFGDLTPGNYNIQFVLPTDFLFSPQDQGTNDAIDSDPDITTGITVCTTLDNGEMDSTWDAGIYLPDEHCTRTIGYWKTHDGSGPQADVVTPLLPIWLGTPLGTKSINVTNTTISHRILSQNVYGTPSNGITKLYAQLLAAKLSIANDANGATIAATIAAADAFLATKNWMDWDRLNKTNKNLVLAWQLILANYNMGLIGPIHCD